MQTIKFKYFFKSIAIVLCAVAISCSNDFEQVTDFEDNQPEQESTNTVITYTLDGKLVSQIKASLIQQYPGDSITGPELKLNQGFVALFYDSLEMLSSQISADRGVWYKQKELMEAYGNVVAYSVDGDTLFTEELFWNQDSSIIYTNAPVKIKKPNATIYGNGLVADQEFKSYVIKSITGQVAIEKDEL